MKNTLIAFLFLAGTSAFAETLLCNYEHTFVGTTDVLRYEVQGSADQALLIGPFGDMNVSATSRDGMIYISAKKNDVTLSSAASQKANLRVSTASHTYDVFCEIK